LSGGAWSVVNPLSRGAANLRGAVEATALIGGAGEAVAVEANGGGSGARVGAE
jgi:hypothetical protein